MKPAVVRLCDVGALDDLAAEARAEGFRFVDRLLNEWESGANRFDQAGEGLFAAVIEGRVVGIAGLNRQCEDVGRVRRVYVHPSFRRRGMAGALLAEVLALAVGHYGSVVLFTDNPDAMRFYEGLGFVTDPDGWADRASHRLVIRETRG